MIERLRIAIESPELLPGHERVVVAVSGGADSTALLGALCELNSALDYGWALHAAHIHHGLRGSEADDDAEFACAVAGRLGVSSCVVPLDRESPGAVGHGSPEEAARKLRYAALERICVEHRAGALAVGHNADDQAETILHHVVRGTGLRGLRGMRAMRPLRNGCRIRLVRPLLGFRRQELLAFLAARGIPYREDSTNASQRYTRNRIRNHVLPVMREQVNPRVTEALLRLGDQARELERFVHGVAHTLVERETIAVEPGRWVISASGLGSHPSVVQMEVIRQALAALGLGEKRLTRRHLRSVCDLLSEGASGLAPELPGGVRARRERDRLILAAARGTDEQLSLGEACLAIPGCVTLPQGGGTIRASLLSGVVPDGPGRTAIERPLGQECLDYGTVAPPLVVRGFRPGERFRPLGAPGRKKVSAFLAEQKVSSAERSRVPVVCDRLGPLWVVPYRIDERAKLTNRTQQVLRLTRSL